MEPETNINNSNESIQVENKTTSTETKLTIPMAIIIVGVLIALAIYLSFGLPKKPVDEKGIAITPVTEKDSVLGDRDAEVALIIYADFQCPFCSAITGLDPKIEAIQYLKKQDPTWTPYMPNIIEEYVKTGKVSLVYRDWPFLGPESLRAAEAARCAGDQNKFWEFHDYLYTHQKGENKGNFSDTNLKSFAKELGLEATSFDKCFDENKYADNIMNSRNEGQKAGVNGTPKGFILKDNEIISTIDGAESLSTVKIKIEAALK